MTDARTLAAGAGVLGPLAGFVATLVATAVSPTFRWLGSALSDLGAPDAAVPWLFNGGLVATALLTLPFAFALWAGAARPAQRLGSILFAVTVAALGLVGAFPEGTALHVPVAVAFFVLVSLTLWVHGSGTVLAGAARRGLAAIWLGIFHVLVWAGWLASPLGGIAVPEIAGTLALYAWILLEVRSLLPSGNDPYLPGG